jgi:5-methylcytosine-specific restriction endonuclease McrA
MPSGIYIRTEEVRNHLSECRKREFLEGKRICWNKGKTGIYSEEVLRKMSENNARRGKPSPQLIYVNTHRKFTPEIRLEMRQRQLGKNGSNWRGGTTPIHTKIRLSIEIRLWREAVLARDSWMCQKCMDMKDLHVHHILNFSDNPSLRTAIDNGVTLCHNCHKLFHKRYGREHNTGEQISEFNSVS